MSNTTKNQHYVPQFMLEKWSINKRIQALNKLGSIKEYGIKNICSVDFIYDVKSPLNDGIITNNKYEKNFSKYETFMSNFLKDFINMLDCNDENALVLCKKEREILLRFAISLAIRNKKMIEYFEQDLNIFQEESVKTFCDSINNFITTAFGIKSKITTKQMISMLNKMDSLEMITPIQQTDKTFKYGGFNDFVYEDLKNGYVYILKNENEMFFTNDLCCTIAITESGYKIIYLPISPKYCFLYSVENLDYLDINKNKINMATDDYCFWLASDIYKDVNFMYSNSKEKLENFLNSNEFKNK